MIKCVCVSYVEAEKNPHDKMSSKGKLSKNGKNSGPAVKQLTKRQLKGWKKKQKGQIIKLVEDHPELYDKTKDTYKRPHLKQDIWDAIAIQVDGNLSGEDCAGKWKNAVDVLRRQMEKLEASGSSGATIAQMTAEWQFWNELYAKIHG